MNNLTLKQLRYFKALAEQGHFGRAAEDCAISQPALSMQIRELEDGLGVPLFERSTRQVHLTAFGEAFAGRVEPILQAVDELTDLARVSREGQLERLRLGIIPTIGPYLLPAIMGDLAVSQPALDLRVRETTTERLVKELADGALDAAILALPISEPSLAERALFEEDFLLVRPSDQAQAPVPSVETLPQMRLLLLEEGHCFRDQALAFCKPAARPRDVLDASSLSTLVQMVSAGLGITLIPEMAAPVETRSAEVCLARFGEPGPKRTIGLVWRETSPLSERLIEFSEVVRASALSMRARQDGCVGAPLPGDEARFPVV